MKELKRELGLMTCILLVIGNIIGIGIFTTPGKIAQGLPTSGWVLFAWLLGGLMATAGALTYAELGAMFPKAGGNYVFLKEAYGPLWGFLYGLAYTLGTSPGAIAMLALGFTGYVGLDENTWVSKGFAISLVLVLTFLNRRGVKLGAGIMDGLTLTKVVVMLLFVFVGFSLGNGESSNFTPFFSGEAKGIFMAVLVALVPMAFAYSGWNSTVLVAEEVKEPGRVIPISLIVGVLATTMIYVLMNAVYLYAVPLESLAGELTVANLAVENLFSAKARIFTQGLVAFSVLGCLSASMLANPRTAFAMGRDGLFLKFTGKIHPKYNTPSGAILFTGGWACVLILIGNFSQILGFVGLLLSFIFTFTIISVFVFRIKRPDQPRPYRCWGYPFVPALYVLLSMGMIYAKISSRGIESFWALGLLALGIPLYYFWVRFDIGKKG